MPKNPLKFSDLETTVRVLRELAAAGPGAFDAVVRQTKTPRTNIVEALDRAEKHFGSHLIARKGQKDRRTDELTEAGELVLKHAPQILWLHSELLKDLASLEERKINS